MPALSDIRKRIRSVRSSQKITKAMKLVAAAKLKRAQEAVLQARPYAESMAEMLARAAARAPLSPNRPVHPMLAMRAERSVQLLVLTSDRGLCGGFNSNVLRRAERFIYENRDRFTRIEVVTVGRKGRDHFRGRRDVDVRSLAHLAGEPAYAEAESLAQALVAPFVSGDLDAVMLLHNGFQSAISQVVSLHDILPIVPEALPADAGVDYAYEPDAPELLDALVPRYLASQIWRALLESCAAEHGARMTAMEAATQNARELSDSLTLQYNRARQATITRELMDIVGGAEAQRHA